MTDDDILDCMDWAEDKLSQQEKDKLDIVEEQLKDLKKSAKPYFCCNSKLVEQLFNVKLTEGQSCTTAGGLLIVCTNNIKDGSFFTNLDFTEEELDELRNC